MATRATKDAEYLELRQADTALVLDAAHGGAVREFTVRGRPILRPTPARAAVTPLDQACFPMVPYCNRIARGRFHFAGHRVRLAPNLAGETHPLHGQGWRGAWTVVEAGDSGATLRFEGGGDAWPWRYRAEQRFEIDTGGFHPYFSDGKHARLQAQLPRVWRTDAAALPVEDAATPAAWRFDSARSVSTLPLDHCFAGWDGEAVIAWPDFFCVEPQTAAAGALVRGDGEVNTIPPGGRAALRRRFDVEMH